MHRYATNRIAFTLIELIITVIIIGVIAGFGIPTYTKVVSRSKEQDAIHNLGLIREAARLYISRANVYATLSNTPPVLADVDAINATFNLHVIEQEGNTYNCIQLMGYTCQADNAEGWQLWFQLDVNDGAIECNVGPCPTL